MALLVWWVDASGGYSPTVWYPAGLFALALAGWLALLRAGGLRIAAAPAARGLSLFAALVALNYLSMLWAGSPGSALDAANKLALYLIVAWIVVALPWTPGRLAAALGTWSAAAAILCAISLADALSARDLGAFFVNARFATPMQYSNATGALAVMSLWPALMLSSRREVPAWLRAGLLAAAAFLGGYAALPESRGALLGLIVTAPVALAASRSRGRLLLRMVVIAGAVAVTIPRAVALDHAVAAGHGVHTALRSATITVALAAAAGLLVGLILAGLEQRFDARHPPAADTTMNRVSRRRLTIGVAAVTGIVLAAATPTVVHAVRTVIRNGNSDAAVGANRLTSISPEERVDYARVSVHVFAHHPVLGVGAGNFGRQYDAQRRFLKHSAYTHDLLLRVLTETGLVGLGLLLGLFAVLGWGLWRLLRGDSLARACAVTAGILAAYFLVHGSLDWLDQFPALAVPALVFPLAALTLSPGAGTPDSGLPRRRRVPAWAGWTAGGLAGIALLAGLGSGYLEGGYVHRAFAEFRARPAAAYRDLRAARIVDPVSAEPATSEGTIALYLGDGGRAQRAFARSLQIEDAWYPRLELALIDASRRQFAAAAGQLAAAMRLDASDPALSEAARTIAAHRVIDPIAFNRMIAQEGDVTGTQGRLR